jgi:hypothetical protein
VADALGISRPTASVLASRGRVREIGRLAGSLADLFRHGSAAVAAGQGSSA